MTNKNHTSGPTQGVSVPLYPRFEFCGGQNPKPGRASYDGNNMPIIIIHNNGTFSTSISTGSSGSERVPGGKLPWLGPFFALVASVIAALALVVIVVNVTVNGPISFDSDNPVNSSNMINGSNNTFIGSISNQGDVSLQLGAGK